MDPITHYMLAYASGKKIKLQKTQLKALTFSALLPDIDVFTIVLGWDFVVGFHGRYTHSITVALLLSLLLSLIFFLHYKKNVIIYSLIGISMHLLFDTAQTLLPEWRHVGIMPLYPFSTEEFALRGGLPYSSIIGVVVVGLLLVCSFYLLYYYVYHKEYPWRIWIDERRIFKALRRR
jgi:membrane-bound metal-dependent hydrolase YbcI (DUF457 family)